MRKIIGLLFLSAGISHAQNTNAPPRIDVHDDFETSELSKFWSTDVFKPGAVTSETDLVRAGQRAVKITLRAKDIFEAGQNGDSDSERDELMEARKLVSKENETYEYSFSMFFPADFPITPTRLVIAQWKQYCANGGNCSDDSPVLAIRYISGEIRITQDLDRKFVVLYREKNEFRGRWLDFKFRVRFSANANGRINAWLGDKQIVEYKGITADSENAATGYPNPSRFYFKMGLYRDVMAEPMTVYIDEYRKKQLPEN
jgi:hypothetical protein